MQHADLLELAAGEPAPAPAAPAALAPSAPPGFTPIKRDSDSLDDFEHLEGAPPAPSAMGPGPLDADALLADLPAPLAPYPAPALSVQSFLDTEREEVSVRAPPPVPAAPPAPPHRADHLADKFTDSESEGESPRRAPPAPAPAPAPSSPRPAEQPPAPPARVASREPALREPARAPAAHVIEAEVIFCQMGLDAWFNPDRLHPKVEALIYWRDPVRSGVALGAGLALLLALACCSVVSVLAYSSLIVLTGTVAFRIYKNILQAVQKTSEGHPFKWLLETDISLPAERSQEIAAAATAHANAAASELRRLFLVEDLIDSLKFGVVLWMFTYVGGWFNGITLIILGYVALFTLPKAYEANKAQVDANLELARAKINEISAKVRAAVPLGKKSDDKKE